MRRLGVWVLVVAAGLAACERVEDVPDTEVRDTMAAQLPAQEPSDEPIEVQLVDSSGTQVGVAHLSQDGTGVEVHVRVSGLEPGTEHGLHFHENGVCEPPTFESAGDHFNPTSRQHGLDNPEGPHVGDMPNIRAGDGGIADTTFVKPNTMLRGDSTSLQRAGGLALIVHAGRDDQRTDPSGDSGARVACGVVQIQ
ncbi:MAG TPA: superoxide dismutase family protein [Longimicrobiales bacterium]